jgi:hypothetical protein
MQIENTINGIVFEKMLKMFFKRLVRMVSALELRKQNLLTKLVTQRGGLQIFGFEKKKKKKKKTRFESTN